MEKTVLRDYFFDHQPPLAFIEDLKNPLFTECPAYYGRRTIKEGEIDASGIYIAEFFPDDEGLLETAYSSFKRMTDIYKISGDRYPVKIKKGIVGCFESYKITTNENETVITANDTEGVRRAVIYLEDMLRSKEGAFLDKGEICRTPKIKSRITRCFFSPINRPPKFGDELSDDIDYYPEEYLNRIMHDGSNGVWIYTSFAQLMTSEYIKENGQGSEERIKKLNRVVEKCRRYGIGVYVFAIEPIRLTAEQAEKYPEMSGTVLFDGSRACCTSSEVTQKYIFEQGQKLATLVPNLKGFISITNGERGSSCATNRDMSDCPRCKDKKRGVVLAESVNYLCAGFKSVNPDIEIISWTYGHRHWKDEDISDYVEMTTKDACLMQNFEDMGVAKQLGKDRLAADYWLSYAGPSHLFEHTAIEAKKHNKRMFAKMQVCCSHEIASVPYIPTPGIIYDKFMKSVQLGVEGVLECWYFGNYPSLMSKAAGEFAFEHEFTDKHALLKKLAAIYFGESRAETVTKAWEMFEDGYINYPINIMFSYYGPAHDGVVWNLALKPKNLPLARTWQSEDTPDGDRIYEALTKGHTIEEALELVTIMSDKWNDGLEHFRSLDFSGYDETEQLSVAECIGVLFSSTKNIIEFFKLREELGLQIGDSKAILKRMKQLVIDEIENSRKMIPLCENDARLGYHSEAEGFKFFPEKLESRIKYMEDLLKTEFVEVANRIENGLSPLEYYDGVEEYEGLPRITMSRNGIENAEWNIINDGKGSKFRTSCTENEICFEYKSDEKVKFTISAEFILFHSEALIELSPDGTVDINRDPTMFVYTNLVGGRDKEALIPYDNVKVLSNEGTHILVTYQIEKLGLDKVRPFKARITADSVCFSKVRGGNYQLGKPFTNPAHYAWFL